jgi:hypothetical protein
MRVIHFVYDNEDDDDKDGDGNDLDSFGKHIWMAGSRVGCW